MKLSRRTALAGGVIAALVVGGSVALTLALRSGGPARQARPTPSSSGPLALSGPAVYIHYYLWWTPGHWRSTLGPSYPVAEAAAAIPPGGAPAAATPPTAGLPLPGSVASNGCGTGANYPGDSLLDLPAEGLYDQGSGATFDHHIDLAIKASITGFLVDWQGTGLPGQNPGSSGYNSRLDLMVKRVDAYNAAHHSHFSLGIAFAAFGNYNRPADQVGADLHYFVARYATDPAFRNPFSTEPVVMMMDSRKFPVATVAAAHAAVSSNVYLVGDETASSWSRDAPYLDASSYYWSSENPYTNARAQQSLTSLGTAVHNDGKRWFAPLIAGYDKQLQSGQCVPRNGLQTLDTLWQLNATSKPDGWFAISWNEFVENTYLEPSVRYGSMYLEELTRLIREQTRG